MCFSQSQTQIPNGYTHYANTPFFHKRTHTSPNHLRASLTAFSRLRLSSTDRFNSSVHSWCHPCCLSFSFFFFSRFWRRHVGEPGVATSATAAYSPGSESHIISTHFTNHDMANMRRLKTQASVRYSRQTLLESLLCANKLQGFDSHSVTIPCHYP